MTTVPASTVGRRGPGAQNASGGRGPLTVQPFLKWAGGKRQLLPALRPFYPAEFGAYFEPFVGSGAVFFDLVSRGTLRGRAAILSDVNRDVVGCYLAIRRNVGAVIRTLRTLAAGHGRSGAEHYYAIRDGKFNPRRQRLLDVSRPDAAATVYPPAVAAMLIYLNRTGYNGLFRVNRSGQFNVPAGRYAHPLICDDTNLRAVARALRRPDVVVRAAAFEDVLLGAGPGDFVYLDPPYVPVSSTSRFTAYTAQGFSAGDQHRLQRVVIELARRKCHVLLSNSVAPATVALYHAESEARRAGLVCYRVLARRAINSQAGRRGPLEEFVVTNIEPRPEGADKRFLGVN